MLGLVIGGWGTGNSKDLVHLDLAELSNFQLLFLQITLFPLSTMEQILIEHLHSWYMVNEYETKQSYIPLVDEVSEEHILYTYLMIKCESQQAL